MLDAYPPIPPKQVTVSCVHLTSYGFLQTPPLASDALAIRIVFPLVRVTPFSFKWTGLPALLGKQQKTASEDTVFYCKKRRLPIGKKARLEPPMTHVFRPPSWRHHHSRIGLLLLSHLAGSVRHYSAQKPRANHVNDPL